MESYISVNGVPVVENTKLMTKLLRVDVGFDGMMVTDYHEINHLAEFHRTTLSTDEATKLSLERESIDMSMVASDLSLTNGTNKLIAEDPAIIARLKESSIVLLQICVSTQCASGDYCEPQWIFGHGLSYTNFTYSDMAISTTNATSSSDSINVSVTVTNSDTAAGKETVMLFQTQLYRLISAPEVKQVKEFSKISLHAGVSQTFELTAADWSVYYPQIGQDLKLVAEDAGYTAACTAAANPLCATFTLSTGEYSFGSLIAE
ncbi:hypothetical protein PInf_005673 [Phytophthora infestans]|nr:hypothetical protein PInf_005673 [Phytophthora infestans]